MQNLRRRNCCNKEFYLECGSLQIKATAHINKQKNFTVDFKELTSEAYSEPSHTYKLQFFSKIFKTSKTSKLFSTPHSKRFAHKNCEVYWIEYKVCCVIDFRKHLLTGKTKQNKTNESWIV